MHDHNTRIVVFADNSSQAVAVATAITKEAFQDVYYYDGSYPEVKQALDIIATPTSTPNSKIQFKFNIDVQAPTVGIHHYTLITDNPEKDSVEAWEIIKAKVLLPLAMQRHDSLLFESILASEFIYQGEEALLNRTEYIQDRIHAAWMISDVQYENLVLEFFDDYGILTYRNKVKEKDEFGKDQLYGWSWTDVWIKENGQWKLLDLRAIN